MQFSSRSSKKINSNLAKIPLQLKNDFYGLNPRNLCHNYYVMIYLYSTSHRLLTHAKKVQKTLSALETRFWIKCLFLNKSCSNGDKNPGMSLHNNLGKWKATKRIKNTHRACKSATHKPRIRRLTLTTNN